MGILSGNPKEEPLHYGEVYQVWQTSMMAKGMVSLYQAFLFHAGDHDLKKLIKDVIDQSQLEAKECDTILEANGFALPPSLPERPAAKLEEIPVGARLSDPELGAIVSQNIAVGLTTCSQIIGNCIREDIGALFAKYHATKLLLGGRALRLAKDKGWLMPPPLQVKRPELVNA